MLRGNHDDLGLVRCIIWFLCNWKESCNFHWNMARLDLVWPISVVYKGFCKEYCNSVGVVALKFILDLVLPGLKVMFV